MPSDPLSPLRDLYEAAYREWKDLEGQARRLCAGWAPIALGSKSCYVFRCRRSSRRRYRLLKRIGYKRNDSGWGMRIDFENWRRPLMPNFRVTSRGILMQLARVGRLLGELAQTDPGMRDCEAQVRDAAIQLKDLCGRLRDYADDLEADPARQGMVEDRLDLIQRLKAKYGGSVEAVLATGMRARQDLQAMEDHESRIADLTKGLEAAERSVLDRADQLTRKRREAAKRLTALVTKELAALKMEHTAFDIAVSTDETVARFGPTGRDHVEFLLSSNVGEPPRPFNRIASGGELSRIMLALKTVLAETDHVPVLVFDEIDTGVGGAVAAAMGTQTAEAWGVPSGLLHHPSASGGFPSGTSSAWWTRARMVKTDDHVGEAAQRDLGREEEIARMIGGETITNKVRDTAAELIAGAKGKRLERLRRLSGLDGIGRNGHRGKRCLAFLDHLGEQDGERRVEIGAGVVGMKPAGIVDRERRCGPGVRR